MIFVFYPNKINALLFDLASFEFYQATKPWSLQHVANARIYLAKTLKKKTNLFHRLFMKAKVYEEVDHINNNGLDNRIENLRLCSHQQNCFNKVKTLRKTTSKYKGVYWRRSHSKWQAQIRNMKGIRVYLGLFESEKAAALAYNEAATREHKQFAVLNNVN